GRAPSGWASGRAISSTIVVPFERTISTRPPYAFSLDSEDRYRRDHSGSSTVLTLRHSWTVSARVARSCAYESTWCQEPSWNATVKMYGSEWSSVSRDTFGSNFCGSFAPDPIT